MKKGEENNQWRNGENEMKRYGGGESRMAANRIM
jgi:hypothetical protein